MAALMLAPRMPLKIALADILDPPPVQIADAVSFFERQGLTADPWQRDVLNDQARHIVMKCSRQSGKSTVVGTKVMHHAKTKPGAMVILGSPTQRQSAELLAKAIEAHDLNHGRGGVALTHWQGDTSSEIADPWDYVVTLAADKGPVDVELESQSRLEVRLANRSRIVAVPGRSAGSVRGYSRVSLLVIDEAAFTPVEFFQAVFPMLAVSGGQIILLSTPYAEVGPYFELMTQTPDWDDSKPGAEQEDAWRKVNVPWQMCPRISPAFIEAELKRYGAEYVAREYECKFVRAIGAVFRKEDVDAITRPDIEVWEGLW